ncbi:hypothetical protein B0H11DRAFT_1965630 [Mycena galericulata]|nr:hypothetical protein B0H11DRAFT_1965630 [Mycena galericulata]
MIRDSVEKNKLRLKLIQPPSFAKPLFSAAHSNPRLIDELLIPHLLDATLPPALAYTMNTFVAPNVSPPLHWGGDPRVPRNDYLKCIVSATMIGRAFSLLSTSSPAPPGKTDVDVVSAASLLPTKIKLRIYAEYQLYQRQRRRFWQYGLMPVFINGLMSGRDPAPASRFAAAILFLTCWTSIKAARPPVKGRGSQYVWWCGLYNDGEWGIDELEGALKETKHLPRDNWNVDDLQVQINAAQEKEFRGYPEYVPLECLNMLDAARKHVADGGAEWPLRDYTSGEVVTMALDVLENAAQTGGSGAKGNWDEYFGQASREWVKEMDGKWVLPKQAKTATKGKRKEKKSVR